MFIALNFENLFRNHRNKILSFFQSFKRIALHLKWNKLIYVVKKKTFDGGGGGGIIFFYTTTTKLSL